MDLGAPGRQEEKLPQAGGAVGLPRAVGGGAKNTAENLSSALIRPHQGRAGKTGQEGRQRSKAKEGQKRKQAEEEKEGRHVQKLKGGGRGKGGRGGGEERAAKEPLL